MHKISKYFRGVNEEARRIRWPDRKTLWKAVAIVLVISIVAALAIYLSDYLTMQIMKAFETVWPDKSSSGDSANSSSGVVAALINFVNSRF